jgi:hypothetical protein
MLAKPGRILLEALLKCILAMGPQELLLEWLQTGIQRSYVLAYMWNLDLKMMIMVIIMIIIIMMMRRECIWRTLGDQ